MSLNVIDSSAWLAYFADEPTAEYFAPAIEDTGSLVVPVVCLYEVFKVLLRESGEDAAFQAVAAMQQGEVVGLDASLALEAAKLGLEENLAFADSIVLAVARQAGATLGPGCPFAGKPRVESGRSSSG
jgi:predicted nucleic acid-binding protein